MIGQAKLQSRVVQLVNNGTFPRFSIIVGAQGSGKKTFAEEIAKMFETRQEAYRHKCPDVKIETVRSVIEQAYQVMNTTIYILPDSDTMSNAAKNALLKVTEEPPNTAYFIMTLEDENNTLETIRSRGTVFHMDRYTPDEIFEYYWIVGEMPNDAELVREICDTPGEVRRCIEMCSGTIQTFYDYVQLVVDNIAEVSLANAFKMPNKIALKDNANGYDQRLFWKAFIKVCAERSETDSRYAEWSIITSKYLSRLNSKSVNRAMLMDSWILALRGLL